MHFRNLLLQKKNNINIIIQFIDNIVMLKILLSSMLLLSSCMTGFNNIPRNRLTSGYNRNLKLLNSGITSEWCKKWIFDMVNNEITYPQFMFIDMFAVRIYAEQYKTDSDMYIGYCPENIDTIKGPIFIGCFKFNETNKTLYLNRIVQNPNYYSINNYLSMYKKDIDILIIDSGILFNYYELSKNENNRYWLEFFYDIR